MMDVPVAEVKLVPLNAEIPVTARFVEVVLIPKPLLQLIGPYQVDVPPDPVGQFVPSAKQTF